MALLLYFGWIYLSATEIRKSVLLGDFYCHIYVLFDLFLLVVQDVQ